MRWWWFIVVQSFLFRGLMSSVGIVIVWATFDAQLVARMFGCLDLSDGFAYV